MGSVSLEFQAWWDKMAKNYNWPIEAGKKWRIDFDTCEVFLD
jgi:CXXX repeat modification system protein